MKTGAPLMRSHEYPNFVTWLLHNKYPSNIIKEICTRLVSLTCSY